MQNLCSSLTASARSRSNIDNIEELICPITLQLFHDPVIAGDGHVYERAAITEWILKDGRSPLTREPLNMNTLQPDNHLRALADVARNETVFHSTSNNAVTRPLLIPIPSDRNMEETHTFEVESQQSSITCSSCRRARKKLVLGLSFLVCSIIITAIIILLLRFGPHKGKSTQAHTSKYKTVHTLFCRKKILQHLVIHRVHRALAT